MDGKRTDGIEPSGGKGARKWIAGFIRKKSKAGQFAFRDEILKELARQSILDSQQHEASELLDTLLEENEDLQEVTAKDGAPRYYSRQFMGEAFVTILLRKEGDPFLLLAETVRENSQVYPRPIPLDAFKGYPFNLTQEEILACLKQMTETDQYKDIQQTTTSIGTVFLYSTLHLDPGHARMLAEWLDVGQFDNP
jgi:hypothetical protein